MGDIKTRADFESDKEGIDSNTISAGEDNLFIIICALVSLRYYFENIASHNDVESILLIDEFDATLHPSLQNRLLKIFREYAEAYKIQIIFTTQQIGKYKLDARFNRQRTSQQLRRFYKAFINLDPPYVNKGAQLYKNAFCEADHRTLSELVKQCHRKWIVTYNICPLVAELYKPYRSSYLDVTYSIQSSKKAQEYIFFFFF